MSSPGRFVKSQKFQTDPLPSYEVTPDALPGERNPDGFLFPHFAQRQDALRLHWWTVCEDAAADDSVILAPDRSLRGQAAAGIQSVRAWQGSSGSSLRKRIPPAVLSGFAFGDARERIPEPAHHETSWRSGKQVARRARRQLGMVIFAYWRNFPLPPGPPLFRLPLHPGLQGGTHFLVKHEQVLHALAFGGKPRASVEPVHRAIERQMRPP